jgi:hypothetical protein
VSALAVGIFWWGTLLSHSEASYILDYKGRCSLLIAGKTSTEETFDQYAQQCTFQVFVAV